LDESQILSSAKLAAKIAATDFSGCAATVVGYGNLGRQYVKALLALRVGQIRVCSRSKEPMRELEGMRGIATFAGGFQHLAAKPVGGELGIVATPTADLIEASDHLVALGYKKLLVEKPVSLRVEPIQQLDESAKRKDIDARCAYNRVAYPSYQETKARTKQEGGITSCTYTFTEFVNRIGPGLFTDDELARWGIANSLHVISMAHGLIGMPKEWSGYRRGSLPWHATGALFVGAGISDLDIPFSYHADWGSTGRWSVEVHTSLSSYRLCPLEKLLRRTSHLSDWEDIPVVAFAQDVKAGIVEEVAAMLSGDIRRLVPLLSVSETAALTRYGEDVFGYSHV
jgi:predicted dehydrogenase